MTRLAVLIAWPLRWRLFSLTALWWVLFLGLPIYALHTIAVVSLATTPAGIAQLYIHAHNTRALPLGGWAHACAATWALATWWWCLSDRERWLRENSREAVWWLRAVLRSGLPPTAQLRRVTRNAGNVHALLRVPRGFPHPPRDALEEFARVGPLIASHYPRHHAHGYPEDIRFAPADDDRSHRVRVSVIRRPLRVPPPLTEIGPARPHEVYLGESHRGALWWDLRAQAHALIAAATRMGKGVLARMLATQALLAGWHVIVLDGTASREWAALAGHPHFTWRPADDQKAWYAWANQTMADTAAAMRDRNASIGAAGYDNWLHATEAGADVGARTLLILDETTATLGVPKGHPAAKAAEQLAAAVDTAVRSWAKAGGHVIIIDQAPYQGLTGLSQATRNQLERYIGIGPMGNTQQQMIGGSTDWPHVSGDQGHGCTGRRGNQPAELRIPNAARDVVERSIAEALNPGSRA